MHAVAVFEAGLVISSTAPSIFRDAAAILEILIGKGALEGGEAFNGPAQVSPAMRERLLSIGLSGA